MDEVWQANPLRVGFHFPKYIFLGPLNIFLYLVDEKGRGIKTDFTSDSFFEIDLNLLAVNLLGKIQNINL